MLQVTVNLWCCTCGVFAPHTRIRESVPQGILLAYSPMSGFQMPPGWIWAAQTGTDSHKVFCSLACEQEQHIDQPQLVKHLNGKVSARSYYGGSDRRCMVFPCRNCHTQAWTVGSMRTLYVLPRGYHDVYLRLLCAKCVADLELVERYKQDLIRDRGNDDFLKEG